MAAPDLTPGCLVVWFDYAGKSSMAMVVNIEEQTGGVQSYYVLKVIKGESRLNELILYHHSRNVSWRVLL